MNYQRKCGLVVVCLGLVACANQNPIVDMKGVDERQYQEDLVECQAYAVQISTGSEAAKRGVIGAAVGATIGAIVGNSSDVEQIAGIGAVAGTSKGASKAERRKERVIQQCLRGRGYKVLG